MTMAKLGRLEGNFIEGMMCEEGCINGAGKFFQFIPIFLHVRYSSLISFIVSSFSVNTKEVSLLKSHFILFSSI
ncbi:[Fe-Fe] hydrogenase large subunit C-terminal domain-containing protein, partial [Clostridioides difficile]|uniref:[Fe-Fe] hydrogenase large subunit C-terminal domain-containing protein n=1 Tax=Clostridioides difficile TaxID=1496 RepID=UPI003F8D19A9